MILISERASRGRASAVRQALVLLLLTVLQGGCDPNDGPNWDVEEEARPTAAHPLAGFWKATERVSDCSEDFGLAIGPSGPGTYYVSFCGPGGCFARHTYRPETRLHGDSSYRVLDVDHIEVKGRDGFTRYGRCRGRKPDA